MARERDLPDATGEAPWQSMKVAGSPTGCEKSLKVRDGCTRPSPMKGTKSLTVIEDRNVSG